MDIRAGFCVREDIPYLLGRTDILSHFDICFESDKRRGLIARRAKENKIPIIYVNLVGGQ